MKESRVQRKISLIIIYGILILTSLVCLLPFVNLLAMSFSSSAAVSGGKVLFWPVDFTTFSYEYAFKGGKFLKALWVSIERVVLGTGINLILMVLTAYPLSKTKEKLLGRNIYMAYFVLTILIGGGLIPTYLVVIKLGLKNSLFSMILPGALPVFNMVILMNFIRGLPNELEEAGLIDGANLFQILTRILIPLLKPALAIVGLFCIVAHWNDWFSALIYINKPEGYPLQTYLQTLLASFESMMKQTSNIDLTDLLSKMNTRTGRAAQLFLGAVPMLLIYPFLQKFFTTGLVLGSVKG